MTRRLFTLLMAASIFFVSENARAQTRPTATPTQAQAAMQDPAIRARILAEVKASGMSPDQIRTRLKSMGYPDDVINQLIGAAGADTTALSDDVFAAVKALGIMDSTVVDSLRTPVVQRRLARLKSDSLLLDSLSVALRDDSVRAAIVRLLASPSARRAGADSGFMLFGRDVFDRKTTQFDPSVNGPLPADYRIGFGDQFTLVFTGDIERTEDLTITRDGLIFVKDAGQIAVGNLTLEQLRATLAARLGRVYSQIGAGTARFTVIPKRVGTNQIFVLGDVRQPNAYQISRLGTVLTALYAAGGPSENGDARSVDVKRDGRVIATMDLYDYLLGGSSVSDVRLENGDVVFVRPRGPRVRVSGAVVRPAIYEMRGGESYADAIRMAGGFRPEADRRRIQVERIVPAAKRGPSGNDKEVLDITSPEFATGDGPTTQRVEAGDIIRVFSIPTAVGNRIDVRGNVFQPGTVGFVPGMRLSQAIVRAGGLKPDTYFGSLLISRLLPDSTRRMTRVALHPDGTPVDDVELAPNDIIRIASATEFRTPRYVTVGGAVKNAREIPFEEGMTLRDAIMLAGGLEESALLTRAEIGRFPESRAGGVTATTIAVPLDSTYLFERSPDGRYLGPPGIPAPAARAPEVHLQPYDAIAILRQPDFEYPRTVSIVGRVRYAGKYVLISKTERLADLIKRAGGLSPDADSSAIVFIRQADSVGRIGVDLPHVLKDPRHVDNLPLVDNDSIFIPAYNAIVMVRGEVNSLLGQLSAPSAAVAYVKGADIDYYIRSAGGGTTKADEDKAYVTQPSGKVETKHRTALLYSSVPHPQPGAIVQVPAKDPNEKGTDWVAITQLIITSLATLTTTALLIIQSNK